MGRLHVGACMLGWLFLLQHARGAAEQPRNGNCLVGALYAPGERANVTVGGVDQPLRVAIPDWDSARILSWIVRVITEEVVGIDTVGAGPYSSSISTWEAIYHCMDLAAEATLARCAGPHLAIGMWSSTSFDAMTEAAEALHPRSAPVRLGSAGYTAYDGIFVSSASYESAMRREHLALDFYMTYSHPAFDPRQYFDSPWIIDTGKLKPCNRTIFVDAAGVRKYVELFNDTDGVTITHGPHGDTYAAKCDEEGVWWRSPTCRANASTCIPLITGGDGWDVDDLMHRATAWRMPVAMAVAADWANYLELPKRHRILLYWWVPDSSFVATTLKKVIWPVHDSLAHSRGDARTEDFTNSVLKFAAADLERGKNAGMSKPLAALRHMKIRRFEVMDLVKIVAQRRGEPDAHRSVACEWLNNNTERYAAWIPSPTACEARQGLVNRSGGFVATREEAQACEWCAPGRMSVALRDSKGATYRCEACGAGTFQNSLGATACERCEEGTFTAERGRHSCQRCLFGEFAARRGQSACDACAPGLITSFLGATSAEACICPEGSYQDGERRSLCLPCKEGMACPAGSDALGYQAQHAAPDFIVPLLEPGFWSSREAPLSVFRCADSVRCPGGRAPGSPCAQNFELQSCGACRAGHVQSRGKCVPCTAPASAALFFPVLPCALLALAVSLVYRFDGKPYERWGSWKTGAAASFFVTLNQYHVVNVIHRLDLIPNKSVSDALEAVSIFSEVMSIFRPQCSGFGGFMSRLVLKSHGPAFIFLIYVAVWAASRLVGMRCRRVKLDPDRMLNGYFSLIFTFFTSIAAVCFTVFKCSDNPNGVLTLMQDRSITCYSGEWSRMLAVGLSAVLVWCVGFGAMLFRAIYVVYERFHEARFRTRWMFLFVRYRPDVHWWAIIIVGKGLMLNMGSLFIGSGVGQIYWILLVLLAYTGLLLTFWPWRHLVNNYVDACMSCSLVLTCAITAWFSYAAMPSPEEQDQLGEWVLQVNLASMGVPLALVVAAMWWRGASDAAWRRKDTDTRLILDAIGIFAGSHRDGRVQFLESLTEHDFVLMKQATDVVNRGLGGEEPGTGCSSGGSSKLSSGGTRATAAQESADADEVAKDTALPGARSLELCERNADPAAIDAKDAENGDLTALVTLAGVRQLVL